MRDKLSQDAWDARQHGMSYGKWMATKSYEAPREEREDCSPLGKKWTETKVKCRYCGKLFQRTSPHQKLCSEECREARRKQQDEQYKIQRRDFKPRVCRGCGNTFLPEHGNARYCSAACKLFYAGERSDSYYGVFSEDFEL